MLLEAIVHLLQQSADARADRAELLCDRLAVDTQILIARPQLLLERGVAHHEEFVEVGADNGEKLHAFEQLVPLVAGLV